MNVLENLWKNGELPKVEVKAEDATIIKISAAVILTAAIIILFNRIIKH